MQNFIFKTLYHFYHFSSAQPRITSKLDIMRLDNGGVRFISSAEASGVDEYRWLKNNVEIRESTNVTVHTKVENNVIEGTLEFNSFNELNDGDIIKAVINNTNIRGETMEDSDRAVLFTISPSTCITTNGKFNSRIIINMQVSLTKYVIQKK